MAMALGVIALGLVGAFSLAAGELPDNRKFGSIVNSDIDNALYGASGKQTTPAEYKKAVLRLLDVKPGLLAQNVGMPDPVVYRSKVATAWNKYLTEVCQSRNWVKAGETDSSADALTSLFDAGADPLEITIKACRERNVPIVASYRMNAEDFYEGELNLYDFGRAHKDLRIPGRNCLDPAHPEVFRHRMEIFTEVATDYDIDGIEFDFRRWSYMISNPHENYSLLTRMVRQTREMLDEVARKKGRARMILGARVGPILRGAFTKEDFPGAYFGSPENQSCEDMGLDVATWIKEGYVDYVCPSFFWPRLPGLPRTAEFVALARGTKVGIYPTVFGLPGWAEDTKNRVEDTDETRQRHRRELCEAALQMYGDGADGISTFNMFPQHYPLPGEDQPGWGKKREWSNLYGRSAKGYGWVLQEVMPKLGNAEGLRRYLKQQAPTSDE